MNTRKLICIALMTASLATAFSANAERWCNGGTIVNAADVQWGYSELLIETQGMTAPVFTPNPDEYLAFTAADNYCQTYAGGAGPNFGVPGNGSVVMDAYAPYSFTNGFNYQLQHGLSFECRKCYAIPPLPPIRLPRF